jgi:hypothetical protein
MFLSGNIHGNHSEDKSYYSLGIRSIFIHLPMVERLILMLRLASFLGLTLLIGTGSSIAQKPGTLKFQYQFPSSGATLISRQATIILRPGDVLNVSTVKASLISVSGSFSGKHAGTLTLSSDHKTLIFKPFTLFTYSERVTVRLSHGILTAFGVPVDSLAFYFTIQPHPHGQNIAFDGTEHLPSGEQWKTLPFRYTEEEIAKPSLSEVYPNPSSSISSIQVNLPRATRVDLGVFDAYGRKVASLASGSLDEGKHTFTFDGSRWGKGIYHYVLTAEGTVMTKQVIVSR